VTQFLTVDSAGMVLESSLFMRVPNMQLYNWNHFALRTTDLVVGSIFYIIFHFFTISLPVIKMLAKAIHWFGGLTMLLIIHNLISNNFISNKNKFHFSLLFIYAGLLLPTNTLALKIFNYDLFSMLLSICAILYLFLAIKDNKYRLALLAIIISFFAAQEKLNASLIFLSSSVVFCYLNSIKSKKQYTTAMFSSILAMLIGLSLSTLTHLAVGIMKDFNFSTISLSSITFPLVAWWWPIIRLIIKGDSHLPIVNHPLIFVALSIFSIFFICIIFLKFKKVGLSMFKILKKFNPFFCWVLFIVGICATYSVNAYWAPYYPIKSGFYHPHVSFNNATWHFDAPTKFMHILNFIVYSISIFINALPLSFWLLLLIVTFCYAKHEKNKNRNIFLGWDVLFSILLLIPIAFGIAQTPVIHRYFNTVIFFMFIIILIKLDGILEYLNSVKKMALVGGFICILLFEILPFRPLYASFRPIWMNYSEQYSKHPVIGQINGSWLGWGEEIMLAGKKIEKKSKRENIDLANIHIYYNYPGQWIDSKIQHIRPITTSELRYSKLDYYILNRLGLVQNSTKFPHSIEPLFTIEHRGFVHAWIFRGDQLKKGNFRFD